MIFCSRDVVEFRTKYLFAYGKWKVGMEMGKGAVLGNGKRVASTSAKGKGLGTHTSLQYLTVVVLRLLATYIEQLNKRTGGGRT